MTINNYIRFNNDFYLIFPHDTLYPTHAHIARAMKANAGMEVISAGQVMIAAGIVVCKGNSETLGIDSLEKEDEEFFNGRLFLPGVSKPSPAAD